VIFIMEELKNYILFPSYNQGLALETILKREKIKYTIVPTPRELSTCCGISIQYNKNDEETIKNLAELNSIQIIGFHSIVKNYSDFYHSKDKL
jgi:hypothetical protein